MLWKAPTVVWIIIGTMFAWSGGWIDQVPRDWPVCNRWNIKAFEAEFSKSALHEQARTVPIP